MLEQVDKIAEDIAAATVETKEELDQFRLQYISKKGIIGGLFAKMKEVAPEERKAFGQHINKLKDAAQEKFRTLQEELENKAMQNIEHEDLTLPGIPNELGSIHPITKVREEIVRIFERIGFNISEGPEIEDDWHNFSALNFPPNHPAREMQDTFFIEKDPDIALRTHTSSVQVRVMENQEPPIRTLSPGRVYRNETISARAHCMFHQIEGLYINENVSFKDLQDTLYYFAKEFFGQDTKIRLRPSYFPFTEPSAELDISCSVCGGDGCNICKYTGWVEIGGCGMVDPNVLKASGIDPEKYTGFAFGMGVERMALLKYGINDLRLFTENDVRFLRQFSAI
ncbi:phenylalanine--tRNA ligase subunit alpha [Algivirga pacifica]|uniref:Phenylalanine--tRNA ligase alpha subunit n=1 Tax=Algivirga pacifica TaxID=1162670 RepID=A0ABP9D5L4_9BACT